MTLRRLPIRRSLSRDNLLLGCERELILISALLSFALIVIGQSLETAAFGFILWIGSVFFLRRMAKKDPHLTRVYLRHSRYRSFYPAKSRPFEARRI